MRSRSFRVSAPAECQRIPDSRHYVTLEQLYRFGLLLYPADYRARFATEMAAAFDQAARQHGSGGAMAFTRFTLAESTGLVLGMAAEWIAKLMSDQSARGRALPDCRKMRPPGVSRTQWSAGL
jgi:hypothetical protein